jgi:hypothetical protein
MGAGDCEHAVEPAVPPGANGPEFPNNRGTACQARGELEEALDDPDRTLDSDPSDCVTCIAQGDARYHRGDPECEADYRTAFLLDARLAASEILRRLEADIRDDFAFVLMDCRKRLRIDSRDIVARTLRGLTLLLLCLDAEALCDLQQVFRQSPVWRPFLRLLVTEAKPRRATVFARILRGH